MVRFIKPIGLVATLSVLGAAGTTMATGNLHAKDRCHKVHGKTNSLITTQNCPSPVQLCTSGQVTGGGPLDGAFFFQAFDVAPSAGMPGVEPGANLSFSGQLTVTTKGGTLIARDLGVVDSVNGFFTEVDRPQSGTGIFANPSNDFFINGTVVDNGGGFSGVISGTLCTDGDMDDD
jgi:hypothetical protein